MHARVSKSMHAYCVSICLKSSANLSLTGPKTSTSHQDGSLIYNKCSSVHLYHRLPPSKVNHQRSSSKCNTMQHISNLIFNLPNFSSLPVSLQTHLTKHSTQKKGRSSVVAPFKVTCKVRCRRLKTFRQRSQGGVFTNGLSFMKCLVGVDGWEVMGMFFKPG